LELKLFDLGLEEQEWERVVWDKERSSGGRELNAARGHCGGGVEGGGGSQYEVVDKEELSLCYIIRCSRRRTQQGRWNGEQEYTEALKCIILSIRHLLQCRYLL
jgi:hypothetical protein